jgi:hypothetical protein
VRGAGVGARRQPSAAAVRGHSRRMPCLPAVLARKAGKRHVAGSTGSPQPFPQHPPPSPGSQRELPGGEGASGHEGREAHAPGHRLLLPAVPGNSRGRGEAAAGGRLAGCTRTAPRLAHLLSCCCACLLALRASPPRQRGRLPGANTVRRLNTLPAAAASALCPAQGPHLPQIEEHTESARLFRNFAGGYRQDGTDGSDMQAVSAGWASVTPLGLRSDLLFKVGRRAACRAGAAVKQGAARRGRGPAAACRVCSLDCLCSDQHAATAVTRSNLPAHGPARPARRRAARTAMAATAA